MNPPTVPPSQSRGKPENWRKKLAETMLLGLLFYIIFMSVPSWGQCSTRTQQIFYLNFSDIEMTPKYTDNNRLTMRVQHIWYTCRSFNRIYRFLFPVTAFRASLRPSTTSCRTPFTHELEFPFWSRWNKTLDSGSVVKHACCYKGRRSWELCQFISACT